MVERVSFGAGFLYRVTQGETSVDIVPYGASIRAIRVPDRDGRLRDVCLGYDSIGEYASQGACFGAAVGRYANRIGGAAFPLNGVTYPLFANEGKNTLHGGQVGYHKRWWNLAAQGEDSVVCTLDSPDNDEGFPGRLRLTVTYTWRDGALGIGYHAVCDADTVVNFTNHSYFNLAGQDGGVVGDHVLTLRSSHFTPIGADKIVTGEIRDVTGTPWDFRSPATLAERWDHPDLSATNGFDHNVCLDPGEGPAAVLSCPRTGISMEVLTDQPGCQLYTAGWLTPRRGKDGARYDMRHGICLETQNYPNAVNVPAFPSPFLKAGEVFESRTVYRFGLV